MPLKIKAIFFKQLAITVFVFFVTPKITLGEELIQKSGKMWELFEWEIKNTSWSGNPFDLLSTVTFVNESNQETRKSRMFYAGNDIWKFRFTGTYIGKWSFLTSSEDSDLNNHRGSIIIPEFCTQISAMNTSLHFFIFAAACSGQFSEKIFLLNLLLFQ